jgi:hypothetical protein
MFAYIFGLSIAPTLAGFYLGLGLIRYVLKMKLIRQLKIISYIAALILATIINFELAPLSGSANVVTGTTLGFLCPILMALLIKKKQKSPPVTEG